MTLVPVDPKSPAAVTHYLGEARRWLETAVETSTPHGIFNAKAEIATAAEATKQLGLSREIQDDAREMVRRAEFTLGKSVRKGQDEGLISVRGAVGPQSDYVRNGTVVKGSDRGDARNQTTMSASDFFSGNDERSAIYGMSDGVSPAQFDEVIDEAKAEGNLSRANVARKAAEKAGRPASPTTVAKTERAHQEAELINSFGSIVRRSLTPKNVATLTPTARGRLIHILETALNTLKETPA